MAAGWTSITVRDSDDTLSSGYTFPRVPSYHPTTNTTTSGTRSPRLISPLLSPPPPSLLSPISPRSPRLQQQRSSGFQSTTGSSSDAYSYGYNSAYRDNSGYLSPRTTAKLDALLERPYHDTPPDSATSPGAGYFRVEPTVEVPVQNGWSPKWLRRNVLSIFLGAFGILAIIGEVVMWFIEGRDVKASVSGLWTFGPVVVSTVLAILWSRVEFQALQYTPWIVLHRKPSSVDETRRKQAHRTVLLNYVSMNSFQALGKAFHKRHHLVVASVLASLLLRAQIVLSTSIFHAEVHADGTKYLRVRLVTLHAMAGVFCLLCMLVLPMLYHAPPRSGITPRDPTSLGGTAALLASSKLFLSRLTGTGQADMDSVAARLPGSWYTAGISQRGRKPEEMFQLKQLSGGPMMFNDGALDRNQGEMGVYRPWTIGKRAQVTSIVISVTLMGSLWAIFGIRGDGAGFQTSEGLYILWTSVPTLVVVLMALFFSRIDIDTRRLAPFIKLATEKCRFRDSFGLTYLNEFGLGSVMKAFTHKDWAVFLKKSIAMLGWLLPIFTAGLFAIVDLKQVAHPQLQQDTWFKSTTNSMGNSLDQQLVENILIRKTPKFPAWTWQDLAFPGLEVADPGKEWPLPKTQLVAKVPAVKALLNCETAALRNGAGAGLECAPLDSDINNAICKDSGSYAGFVAASCDKLKTAYSINYIWGSCANDGFMTIMMCNESFVEVDIHTTFHSEDLTIDTNSIPLLNSTSVKPIDLSIGVSGMYGALENISSDDSSLAGLDGFFKTLVLSRLDMPLERLQGEERKNSVAQAVRTQHGILRAQMLNSETVRQPMSASDAPQEPATLPASVNYFISRLKQSRMQTGVLAGLLAGILVLAALSLRTIQAVTLPKDPGSIAAQASLLADSTIWWRMPDGAEYLSDSELTRKFRRKYFKLGWFTGGAMAGGGRNGISEKNYGISIVQDEGKVARVELEGDSMFPGRFISMKPGEYGDVPLFEKP